MNVVCVSFAYIILFGGGKRKKTKNVKGTDRAGGCLQTGRPHITLPLSLLCVCRVRTTHAECPWPDTHTQREEGFPLCTASKVAKGMERERVCNCVCVYDTHDNWPLAYFWMPMCSSTRENGNKWVQ
jgi:hypothetical protein